MYRATIKLEVDGELITLLRNIGCKVKIDYNQSSQKAIVNHIETTLAMSHVLPEGEFISLGIILAVASFVPLFIFGPTGVLTGLLVSALLLGAGASVVVGYSRIHHKSSNLHKEAEDIALKNLRQEQKRTRAPAKHTNVSNAFDPQKYFVEKLHKEKHLMQR